MFESIYSLLVLVGIAVSAYGLGRPLLVRWIDEGEDPLAETVWCLAVGLVVAGLALLLLGLVGLLYRPLLIALTSALFCWGLTEVAQAWFTLRFHRLSTNPEPWSLDGQPPSQPPAMVRRGAWGLALAIVTFCLVTALAPPTAGDALCYHLELPKQFLRERGLFFSPEQENCTYPLLAEMWFLWGLALDSGVAAQLVHAGLGVLWALAAVVLATPLLSRGWAWLVGLFVLAVPGVSNQMTAPLNDLAAALFCTLALAAWRRALAVDQPHWFALAGLMLGAACGIKYLALLFGLAWLVTAGLAYASQPQRRPLLRQGLAIVCGLTLAVSGTWYARAWWHRGNPVYPFFSSASTTLRPSLPKTKRPLALQPDSMALSAWLLTMEPQRFGGRGHQWGPWPLMVLPVLVLCRRLRGLPGLLGLAALYALGWYLLRQNLRFLLPILPLLATAAVWLWIELLRFPTGPRWIITGLLTGALLWGGVISGWRTRDTWAVALGWEAREAFLRRTEPTYAAAELANSMWSGAPQMRLLSQDYRSYYFACPVTREVVYRHRTRYHDQVRQGSDLVAQLRRDGFTHLLVASAQGESGIRYQDTLGQLVEAARRSSPDRPPFLTLTEYEFADRDGARRHYQLLMLR